MIQLEKFIKNPHLRLRRETGIVGNKNQIIELVLDKQIYLFSLILATL
jgi:hypothetical protein